MTKYLILGGVRSGKSSYAESLAAKLAKQQDCNVSYIATAEAFDSEMKTRITKHQQTRCQHWHNYECATRLVETLEQIDKTTIILIDCLTLWLNNCLYYQDVNWRDQKQALLDWLNDTPHTVILVSNEVGFSITPDNPLARKFADQQGWLNQDVAKCVNNVTLTIAGIPYELKND